MKFKISCLALLLLMSCFNGKANDLKIMNAAFSTASKIAVIDNELGQAKSFKELHYVLLMMGDIVFKDYGDTCNVPKDIDFKAVCADIEYFEYYYEKRILELSCVNVRTDDVENVKRKVQKWWNKFKTKCKCDSLSFGLSNGNLLKFALAQNYPDFVETLASTYGCDINFIDPVDGLNLLDFINAEIERYKKMPNGKSAVKVYEEYKATVIGLGGKSNKKYNSY